MKMATKPVLVDLPGPRGELTETFLITQDPDLYPDPDLYENGNQTCAC